MCAMSGTPLPAFTAFCRAVYSSLLVPALTRLTCTFGYLAWKFSTTFFSVGSQDHTVRLPPAVSAACRSASETVAAWALPLPPPVPEEVLPPLLEEPQAVAASATASAVAPSRAPRRRVIVIAVPFLIPEGFRGRAGAPSTFHASGAQARLPIPLKQQERRDQRDDRHQGSGDDEVEHRVAAGRGGLVVPAAQA